MPFSLDEMTIVETEGTGASDDRCWRGGGEMVDPRVDRLNVWSGGNFKFREQGKGIGLEVDATGPIWYWRALKWTKKNGVWRATWCWIVDQTWRDFPDDDTLYRALQSLQGHLIPIEVLRIIAELFVANVLMEYGLDNTGEDADKRWWPMPYYLAELSLVSKSWFDICAPLLHRTIFVPSTLLDVDDLCACLRRPGSPLKEPVRQVWVP